MRVVDSRVRAVTWMVLGVAGAALVAAVLAGVVLVAQIRSVQAERTPKNEANDETLSLIKDCTDPTGECYQRGQEQTASAVASIQQIIVLSAACSLNVPADEPIAQRVAAITQCVNRGLK